MPSGVAKDRWNFAGYLAIVPTDVGAGTFPSVAGDSILEAARRFLAVARAQPRAVPAGCTIDRFRAAMMQKRQGRALTTQPGAAQ